MSRKKKSPPKPSPEELDAQADDLIRQDNERMQREFSMAEIIRKNTELIEQIHRDLIQPNNDPHYLKALQDCKAQRDAIAAKVPELHMFTNADSTGRTWIGAPFNHADGEEVGRALSEHLEAKLQRHEGSNE